MVFKIIYINDRSIFDSDADLIINSVNVKGVMGAGIAREFKKRYPQMFKEYVKACRKKVIRVLAKFIVDYKDPNNPKLEVIEIYEWKPHIWVFSNLNNRKRIILNFPTKIYWDLPSDYKIIEAGIKWLKENIDVLSEKIGRKIEKIAMPKIGCGLGGLNWDKVKEIIKRYFSDSDIIIEVYVHSEKRKAKSK